MEIGETLGCLEKFLYEHSLFFTKGDNLILDVTCRFETDQSFNLKDTCMLLYKQNKKYRKFIESTVNYLINQTKTEILIKYYLF